MATERKFWILRGGAGTLKSGGIDLLPDDNNWFEAARKLSSRGRKLRASQWPSPPPTCRYTQVAVFPDAAEIGMQLLIVSDRLRRLLSDHAPGAAEFHPIRLQGPNSQNAPGYCVPIWLQRWDCQPDPDIAEIDPTQIQQDARIGVIGGTGWWIGGRPMCSNEFTLKLQKAKVIGLRFEPLALNSPPEATVRRKDHRTGKMTEIEYRLIPGDRRFDVDAYFASGRGADDPMDVEGSTAFHDYVTMHPATNTLDYSVVLRFLREGADPNVGTEPHLTPIVVMLGSSTPAVLNALVRQGADFSLGDWLTGGTPLMSAVAGGNVPCVRHLLALGVDPNQQDRSARTALHALAATTLCFGMKLQPFRSILRLLITSGGSPEARSIEGYTVLGDVMEVWAYRIGAVPPDAGEAHPKDVVCELLKHGADPNCRIPKGPSKLIPDGGTPLMCQRYDDGEIHLELLKAGGDPTLCCPKGLSAIGYAERRLKTNPEDRAGCIRALTAMRKAAST